MLTFDKKHAHLVLILILLFANGLLYLIWPWLRAISLDADSIDDQDYLQKQQASLRNEAYITSFFNALHADKRILFLGTSESTTHYDFAAQLNYLAPDNPKMIKIAWAGLSPIHRCLMFAKCKREGIRIPPLVIILNLTYFERAHDVIDDGYLTKMVRSPVFMQMNHHNIYDYLSNDVREAYAGHFVLKNILYPVMMQKYLGNLLYLFSHQAETGPLPPVYPSVRVYKFDGVLPEYDEARCVHEGNQTADRYARYRWRIKPVEESLNLKGVSSSMVILREQSAPVLLLILPTNRTFYEYSGIDMNDYDKRYVAIRKKIRALAVTENTYLIDLYEKPKLHLGFEDRMHLDEYGHFQLAKHIVGTHEYFHFIESVQRYYSAEANK